MKTMIRIEPNEKLGLPFSIEFMEVKFNMADGRNVAW